MPTAALPPPPLLRHPSDYRTHALVQVVWHALHHMGSARLPRMLRREMGEITSRGKARILYLFFNLFRNRAPAEGGV